MKSVSLPFALFPAQDTPTSSRAPSFEAILRRIYRRNPNANLGGYLKAEVESRGIDLEQIKKEARDE
jgi:hypothetical protein